MKWRHATQILTLAALLAACGSEARVEQPDDCRDAVDRPPAAPVADDIRVGEAWFAGLRWSQRQPWRERWIPEEGYAAYKAHVIVPAGGTLRLSVPPEARSLLKLDYGDELADTATLSACHGQYAAVPVTGALWVRRPLCRVPLDWRYGSRRGRLRLTFGRACA